MIEHVAELYGVSTLIKDQRIWKKVIKSEKCPYLRYKCIKRRKTLNEISIGTCMVCAGKAATPVVICPKRMLQRKQIFVDALQLLTLHEPGNEYHLIPELTIPGGSVDYFLVSARNGKPKDFVGIEVETMDTTGSAWPARQRFLKSVGLIPTDKDAELNKFAGMNWKHSAKTILVQLHHKVETFENLNKHLVLVLQDCFLDYMLRTFAFEHIKTARIGDAMHFHPYGFELKGLEYHLNLGGRLSTDAAGVAKALGLQAVAKVELNQILTNIERKMSKDTIWSPV